MGKKIKSFRDLDVWNKGMEVVKEVYDVSRKFPREEMYGLTSQIRKCAISIPSNIAEGFQRKSRKEYKYFLSVALGSCAELETQVEISLMLDYINSETRSKLLSKVVHAARMLENLRKCL